MKNLIKVLPADMIGNTLKAAAMTGFSKSHQRDVKIKSMFGSIIVSIFISGSWIDYDFYKDGEAFVFLLAQ
jgi:hypothetical protein|tara:strand:- start:303 stop:515 length:213 start_codon:yes stop_codon:yes gene_type:complete